mmetsp:Transcript_22521/g.70579  ORF Transcript_22521/g.70579 Transcript_22521/m.70579 type:complete len:260 (-) Transcript_22521:92-871(-)
MLSGERRDDGLAELLGALRVLARDDRAGDRDGRREGRALLERGTFGRERVLRQRVLRQLRVRLDPIRRADRLLLGVGEARDLEAGYQGRAVGLHTVDEAAGAVAERAHDLARGVRAFDDGLERRRGGAVEVDARAVAAAHDDGVVRAGHRRVDLDGVRQRADRGGVVEELLRVGGEERVRERASVDRDGAASDRRDRHVEAGFRARVVRLRELGDPEARGLAAHAAGGRGDEEDLFGRHLVELRSARCVAQSRQRAQAL